MLITQEEMVHVIEEDVSDFTMFKYDTTKKIGKSPAEAYTSENARLMSRQDIIEILKECGFYDE
jgi:hypothetical protein